jgi:hypothetical protein
MAAVQRLCSRCVYLRQGAVVLEGATSRVIDRYVGESAGMSGSENWNYLRRNPGLEIESVALLVNGEPSNTAPAGSTLTFRANYRCREPERFPEGLECGFIVYGNGQKLANFWTNAGLGRALPVAPSGVISCTVPAWPFRTMPMSLQVHLNYRLETLVDLPEALLFESLDSDRFGTGVVPHASEGIVLLPHTWASESPAP